ncbi:MAG: hypothetical protein AAB953_01695, partial [Patescibacteria group bacterium]
MEEADMRLQGLVGLVPVDSRRVDMLPVADNLSEDSLLEDNLVVDMLIEADNLLEDMLLPVRWAGPLADSR